MYLTDILYFCKGKKNFSYDSKTGGKIIVKRGDTEKCGFSLIKGKHIGLFPRTAYVYISNYSDENLIVRVEKKLHNDVKTGIESVNASSTKKLVLTQTTKEMDELESITISAIASDNTCNLVNFSVKAKV